VLRPIGHQTASGAHIRRPPPTSNGIRACGTGVRFEARMACQSRKRPIEAHGCATASHARGRWFETSRAHPGKSLLSGMFRAGRGSWDSPLRPVENGAGARWYPIEAIKLDKPSRSRLRRVSPWHGAGLLLCMGSGSASRRCCFRAERERALSPPYPSSCYRAGPRPVVAEPSYLLNASQDGSVSVGRREVELRIGRDACGENDQGVRLCVLDRTHLIGVA
jgi:hypothetical protein